MTRSAPQRRLLAIDVGTLSARAGLFETDGTLVAVASTPCELIRPEEDHAVYRMADIWSAVCRSTAECLAKIPGAAETIAALAFDATSSLYLETDGAAPLSEGADVICWMDHRGEAEAAEIDATRHRLLDFVGGSLSPETHLPKLLWLKRREPEAYARITAARDLCDELAFRATGAARHSSCGLSCKWPYLAGEADPWCRDLLARLGMAELVALGALGETPGRVGDVHGRVSLDGTRDLGIPTGIPVAVGLIDAEAGALGVLGRTSAAA